MLKVTALLFLLLLQMHPVYAYYSILQRDEDLKRNLDQQPFQPYETNAAFFKFPKYNDANSLEINISQRYFFRNDQQSDNGTQEPSIRSFNFPASQEWLHDINLYFSFTGRFDFFWSPFGDIERDSKPVISRFENPAFHILRRTNKVRATPEKRLAGLQWFDLGIEHMSNGQSIDANDPVIKPIIQQAYLERDNDPSAYKVLDSISRTNATIALTAEAAWNGIIYPNNASDSLFAKIILRSGQEADVYWGRYANTDVDFDDYHLFRLQYTKIFPDSKSKKNNIVPEIGFELIGGKKMFEYLNDNILHSGHDDTHREDAWNIHVVYPVNLYWFGYIPLAFKVHYGPMDNISLYTTHVKHYSVGVAFSY